MNKIRMYVEAFGGTYVGAYEELLDSGDVKESANILGQCKAIDASKRAKGRAFLAGREK